MSTKPWRIEDKLKTDDDIIGFAKSMSKVNDKEDMQSALEIIAYVLECRAAALPAKSA